MTVSFLAFGENINGTTMMFEKERRGERVSISSSAMCIFYLSIL